MSGYALVTWVHSYLRWLILIALIVASVKFAGGWRAGRPWDAGSTRLLKATVGLLDLQLLLGLLLYFLLSPLTELAFRDMGAAMRSAPARFFVVEHATMMVAALVAVHVTSVRVRRAKEDPVRQRRAAIGVMTTLLFVCVGIPWPFLAYGRPLFRAFG